MYLEKQGYGKYCVVLLLLLLISLAGCTAKEPEKTNVLETITEPDTDNATDDMVVTITGSKNLLPVVQNSVVPFMEENPYTSVMISESDLREGIKEAGEGSADVGLLSGFMTDAEKKAYPNLFCTEIGYEPVAVVVHQDNPVNSLSYDNIKAIYEGKISDWGEVGGTSGLAVNVFVPENSDINEFIEGPTGIIETKEAGCEYLSTDQMINRVSSSEGSIGYIKVSSCPVHIKIIDITNSDGELTDTEWIKSGKFACPVSFVTDSSKLSSGSTVLFTEFMKSEKGQKIVGDSGFFPLSTP